MTVCRKHLSKLITQSIEESGCKSKTGIDVSAWKGYGQACITNAKRQAKGVGKGKGMAVPEDAPML